MKKQNDLSFIAMYDFIMQIPDLTLAERMVYALIYSFSADDKEMFCSKHYISKRLGISEGTVYRALKNLISKSLIYETKMKHGRPLMYSATDKNLRMDTVSGCNVPINFDDVVRLYGSQKNVRLTHLEYISLINVYGKTEAHRIIEAFDRAVTKNPEKFSKNKTHYFDIRLIFDECLPQIR